MASSLQDTIFSLPIVDTHTHIIQWQDVNQPFSALDFFNSSGCLRAFWTHAGALSRQEYRAFKRFDDWPSLSAAIDRIKALAFYRMLLDGLRSLHDMDFVELDEKSFLELSEKMKEAYRNPDWYRTVLRKKAGLETILQDSGSESDRSLFTRVARFDPYVWFGKPSWAERIIRKYGKERTSNLEDLVCCLRRDFTDAMDDGAASVKSNNCWGRTLEFLPTTEAEASDALAKCRKDPSDEKAVRTLGDYMMYQIAQLCAEHNIPLQIHTGPAGGIDHMVQYGNPLNLNTIILHNPETKFVIFHAGGPFVSECCSLASQFQNVYLDLCGVIARGWLRRILDEWIEFVPLTKLMWGTDVNMVEESYAIVRNFRQVLSDFLDDRIKSGYLSCATAKEFARAVTADNAKRILRLPNT